MEIRIYQGGTIWAKMGNKIMCKAYNKLLQTMHINRLCPNLGAASPEGQICQLLMSLR